MSNDRALARYRRHAAQGASVGERPLPSRGTVTVHGARYLVESFSAGRFPVGTLRISLLVRQPLAALARVGCAQGGADVLADVARRAQRRCHQDNSRETTSRARRLSG